MLVHVADAPLVAGHIGVGRCRHIALTEDVDGHATGDAAIEADGRLQQLAVLVPLARIRSLRGSSDLRGRRVVLRQLHIADDLAGGVLDRVDSQEQTIQTHFTEHAGVLVRTARLPAGIDLPVVADVGLHARTPREHGVHVVGGLGLIVVVHAQELAELIDLDGRHVLGSHFGLHCGRQIRVAREDRGEVRIFELGVAALVDRVGLRRAVQHMAIHLHAIVDLVFAAQEG